MSGAVITGATGVIGMALTNKLIEEKIHVTVLVNPGSKRLERISKSEYLTVVSCGLADYKDITNLPDEAGRPEVFYHLAWAGTFGADRNNKELQKKNVEYTLDAVKLAHRLGCRSFIGVGSQAEYGRVSGVLTHETPCNPENEYGINKLEAGIKSRELARELGIKHIWTRVLSIYGPYDGDATMVTSTINKLLSGQVPELTKGEQLWDYLYSKDAAKALFLLGFGGEDCLGGVDGSVYPIGSGKARPLKEYIEIIRDEVSPCSELGFGMVPYADKQVMHLCADISLLKRDVDFSADYSFKEGIKETVAYIKQSSDF